VRGGLVAEAAAQGWPSAAVRCGTAEPRAWLEMTTWREQWSEFSDFLT